MPFDHHNYLNAPSAGDFAITASTDAPAVASPTYSDVGSVPDSLRKHGVAEIILVHGTFAGNDVIGLIREVGRFSPKLAGAIKTMGKQSFDAMAGDIGNYTQAFADCLSDLINHNQPSKIAVTRYTWSGENHHLGRADGAIGLMDLLFQRRYDADDRVLVWGHSHGGNLLAMMGQLIGASDQERQAFFAATRSHYRNPLTGKIDLPRWVAVCQSLCEKSKRESLPRIDVATFGTPLRYRFNTIVQPNVMHFVQHRCLSDANDAKAIYPTSIQDLLEATGGDYVQQFGIGGTDFLQSIFAPRSWFPERRLAKMFESSVRRRDLPKNLKRGHRVSLDGTTLLVDYPDTDQQWNRKLLGHGVYTRPEWLPFHLSHLEERFYPKLVS